MTEPAKTLLSRTLATAASGDAAAWRALVDAFAPRVFALLRAQCGDPELAEEITQSAFCTVASKLAGYTEVGRFEAWLFRIAMNRLRDEMRRRKRQAHSVDANAFGALSEARSTAAEDRAEPSELAALRSAMTRLSEADRHIVHLRHWAGLSFKQISEVLNEPLGTVLARQHRALAKLADLMKAASDDSSETPAKAGDAAKSRRSEFRSPPRQ